MEGLLSRLLCDKPENITSIDSKNQGCSDGQHSYTSLEEENIIEFETNFKVHDDGILRFKNILCILDNQDLKK